MPRDLQVAYVDGDPDRRDRTAAALERVDRRLTVATARATDEPGAPGDDPVDCAVIRHDPPAIDGLDALAALREDHPELPVVLVAARGSEPDPSEAVALGVTEYLREDDLDPAEFAERVASAAATWRDEREERESRREDGELLDAIFKQLPVHLFVKDDEARYVKVNEYYLEEDGEFYHEFFDDFEGPESLLGRTDVELYPGEFSRMTYEDDLRVIETNEPIIDQEEYLPFIGEWNLVSKVPWRGPDGEVKGLIGTAHRITRRKAHREALERQNERLERITSVVAHDLRNPLNVADGYLEETRAERDTESLTAAADAIERCEAIVEDALTLLRRGQTVEDAEPVELDSFAHACWENVVTGSATLVAEDAPTVRGDPTRLYHLFENLFRNAVEHGSTSPASNRQDADRASSVEPSVADATEDAVEHGSTSPASQARQDADEHAGTDLTVRVGSLEEDGFFVEDDGPGIPESEREEVFRTGYSTSERGTGFGLSIVEEIATAHGWDVTATESDDGGARFEFRETASRVTGEYAD